MHANEREWPIRVPEQAGAMTRYPRAVCIHAAAHAVARLVIGRKAERIDLRRHAGRPPSWSSRMIPLRGQYDVWDEVLLLLAGPFAEARVRKRAASAVLRRSPQTPHLDADRWLRWLVDQGFAADVDDAWLRAQAEVRLFLQTHWRTIELIAGALRARGVLEPSELTELFGASATTTDRW